MEKELSERIRELANREIRPPAIWYFLRQHADQAKELDSRFAILEATLERRNKQWQSLSDFLAKVEERNIFLEEVLDAAERFALSQDDQTFLDMKAAIAKANDPRPPESKEPHK